jgi:hypothetical protein
MKKMLACLLGFGLVAGCGQDNRSPEPEPMPVEETVFGDQVEQIQRAEDLNRQMQERMPNLNKELDSAEGASSADPDSQP